VPIYPVKGSLTKWVAVITNGPEFAARLLALDLKVGRVVARMAVAKGAEVMRDEWKARVPIKDHYYQNSITYKSQSGSFKDDSGEKVLKGASALIYPGVTPGPDDAEQPWRYAGVLEYGGRLTAKQHYSLIPAQPSARPAFDSSKDRAVDAVAAELRRNLP
jgi:HK97 gp10 family phage protein